ncbi:hypothetical protein D3C71_1614540 [compost metagenome]
MVRRRNRNDPDATFHALFNGQLSSLYIFTVLHHDHFLDPMFFLQNWNSPGSVDLFLFHVFMDPIGVIVYKPQQFKILFRSCIESLLNQQGSPISTIN